MKKKVREILSKYRQNEGYTMQHAERELLDLFSITNGFCSRCESDSNIYVKYCTKCDSSDILPDYYRGDRCLDCGSSDLNYR